MKIDSLCTRLTSRISGLSWCIRSSLIHSSGIPKGRATHFQETVGTSDQRASGFLTIWPRLRGPIILRLIAPLIGMVFAREEGESQQPAGSEQSPVVAGVGRGLGEAELVTPL
jgi:hypothetical protein